MKKNLHLLIALALALLLLTACGRPAGPGAAPSPSPAETAAPAETPAPAETEAPSPEAWEPGDTPAPLTYSWGLESREAILDGTWSWHYVTGEGEYVHRESTDGGEFQSVDWLDGTHPVLRAEGEVTLSFPCRMPETMRLYVFSPMGLAPAALEGNTFTPYAGANAYVLEVNWKRGTPVNRSSAKYILLVDGACPGVLPETDAGVTAALLEADARGCSFTLENGTQQIASLGATVEGMMGRMNYALFRRTDFGGWEWLPPERYDRDDGQFCGAGSTQACGLDWSWCQGTLEPGEYAVLFSGVLTGWSSDGTYAPPAELRLPLYFTLGEEDLPEPPGPLAPQAAPEGMVSVLEQLSPHRWGQQVPLSGEDRCFMDRDFSLFRLEADGSLTYIRPAYALPAARNEPIPLTSTTQWVVPVELAAAYGDLEAGDYVLRRRLYPLEPDVQLFYYTFADRSWRTVPEDRILYLDTAFTLESPLSAVPLPVEPCPQWADPIPEPDLPVRVSETECDAWGYRLRLENSTDQGLSFSGVCDLYYLWEGEWLPLEKTGFGLFGPGLLGPENLEPAGDGIWAGSFATGYAVPLAPGTYRLVTKLFQFDGVTQMEWRFAADFTVPEAG